MADTSQLFLQLARGASFKKTYHSIVFPNTKETISVSEDRARQRRMKRALDFFGDNEEEDHHPLIANAIEDDDNVAKKLKLVADPSVEEEEEEEEIDSVKDSYDSSQSDVEDISITESTSTAGIQLFSDKHNVLASTTKKKEKKAKKKTKTKELSPLELKKFKANQFRSFNHIYVSGDDIPDAIASFDDIKERVPSCVLKNLATMGYDTPTPVQMQVIPLLLEGREILACAPTGSGKTAAFGIPIIAHLKKAVKSTAAGSVIAIVVCPTRELALQTQREFNRLSNGCGFRIHVISGQKSQVNFKTDILVTTPIRLIKLLADETESLNLSNVQWLIFDECDKLFEDGTKGFKKQIADIYSACDHPGIKHALFSATLTTGVEQFCKVHLDSFVQITVGKVNTTADIKQKLMFVGQEEGKLIAVRDIIRKGFTPPLLIFVQSVERAKHLFHELIYDGVNVDVIHSERTQAQRDNIVKSFRAGKIWVLICTDLMGRGIDFKGVNLVINYDFPPNAISYIHRIGRTGRAGRKGEAVTLFTEDDIDRLRSIASIMRNSGCTVPDWMLQLKKQSKAVRKALAKKSVKRKSIRTTSRYDLEKSKKKRDMILASKKRKSKTV